MSRGGLTRNLGWVLVLGLILLAVMGLLTSFQPFYHSKEEREAIRALTSLRENPSAEAEERWNATREIAWRKEMKLRGAAFLIGGLAAVSACLGARRLRRSAREALHSASEDR